MKIYKIVLRHVVLVENSNQNNSWKVFKNYKKMKNLDNFHN